MSTQMRDSIVTAMNAIQRQTLTTRHRKRAQVVALPCSYVFPIRHTEITIMAPSRRDFLKTSACALGGMALASSIENLGLVHAMTPQSATDYKALVCIFLNGGNDGNNMVIPFDLTIPTEYPAYSAARSRRVSDPAREFATSFTERFKGGRLAFTHNMADMKTLFDQSRLAMLCNNGPLVEPLTNTTYQNGTGKKPLQLFSHSDQVGLFQTAFANTVSQTGWGGRLADKMARSQRRRNFPVECFYRGCQSALTGVEHTTTRSCRL